MGGVKIGGLRIKLPKLGSRKKRGKSRRKKRKTSKCPGPKVNPRTGTKTKYLGHRVKDVGKPGLDSPKEFREIKREILEDYRRGCIDKSTARGRLLLLYRLTFVKKNEKVRNIPPATRRKLRQEIKRAMERL